MNSNHWFKSWILETYLRTKSFLNPPSRWTLIQRLLGTTSFLVCTYQLLRVIRQWMNPRHNVPFALPTRQPPDPQLFPQYLQNNQGLWLYWHAWPVAEPRGVVFLCAGLGEHTVRYQMLSAVLNAQGYATFSLDHQGHGASEGDRAHVERFQHYVDDYLLFVRTMLEKHPHLQALPRFLLGHSMGGLIAIHVRMRSQALGVHWDGTILSAPALKADPKVATPFKIFLAGLLADALPKLSLDPLNSSHVSRSQQVVELYQSDPLVHHGGIRARWGNELLRAMREVFDRAPTITWPFLLLHGGDDRITIVDGSNEFFARVASPNKTLKVYPGMYHEIFNEPDRSRVFDDVFQYLSSHSEDSIESE